VEHPHTCIPTTNAAEWRAFKSGSSPPHDSCALPQSGARTMFISGENADSDTWLAKRAPERTAALWRPRASKAAMAAARVKATGNHADASVFVLGDEDAGSCVLTPTPCCASVQKLYTGIPTRRAPYTMRRVIYIKRRCIKRYTAVVHSLASALQLSQPFPQE
jgi:hypothetical protein